MSFTAEAVCAEMQGHVQRVAALAPEDSRKAALTFTARVLRLPIARVKALFYGEARRIEAHEADQIRAYVQAAEKLITARADYEALRQQYLAANSDADRAVPGPLARTQTVEDAETAIAEYGPVTDR